MNIFFYKISVFIIIYLDLYIIIIDTTIIYGAPKLSCS